MAAVVSLDPHAALVCLFDGLGRFLCMPDGPEATAGADGTVSERTTFMIVNDGPHKLLRCASSGAFVCENMGTLVPCEDGAEATPFEFAYGDDGVVQLRISSAGGDRLVSMGLDGLVNTQGQGTSYFTLLPSPVMGSTSARWAVDNLHGAKVSLWAGPQAGWVTAHPQPKAPAALLGALTGAKQGGCEVTCRTYKLANWEQFSLTVVNGSAGTIALKSDHGLWLCAEPDGTLVANRSAAGEWETFTLIQAHPSSVALRTAHGTYVSTASGQRLDAKATAIGEGERFTLFESEAARARYLLSNPAGVGLEQ